MTRNDFIDFVRAQQRKLEDAGIWLSVDGHDFDEQSVTFRDHCGSRLTLTLLNRIAGILGTDRIDVTNDYEADYSELTPGDGYYQVIRVSWADI